MRAALSACWPIRAACAPLMRACFDAPNTGGASAKAREGKHENENGRSGSAVPSPQRNVNKIRDVRNTNHAPATMLYNNNMKNQRLTLYSPVVTRYQLSVSKA